MRSRIYERRSTTISKPTYAQTKTPSLRFYVGQGNNSALIRRVLSTRKNWQEISDSKYLFINMRWQQSSKGYNYDNCVDTKVFRHSLNHLEFHQELSNKEFLFKNLCDYCESNRMNVFSLVPATFCLNVADSNFDSSQNQFLKFYEQHLPEPLKTKDRKQWLNLPKRRTSASGIDRRSNYNYSKPELADVFMAPESKYLWLLKPTSFNRGNGIHIFNDIRTLEELMKKAMEGEKPPTMTKSMVETNSSDAKKRAFRIRQVSYAHTITTHAFIIQKYLERPLLIDGRKFDIRVWVLFTQEMKVYFFKEGYIRTCSAAYSTKDEALNDLKVHLTNNSVQKNLNDYGKFEEGNQLSFKFMRNYVEKKGGNFDKVIDQMKKIAKITALSVRKKINKINRQWCFEIFGYDFMVDDNLKPWLIQVNTNPCLQESSLLLENLLPRMIDDTFKLTIDEIFKGSQEGHETNYVLQHYENSENLWQELIDLKKNNSV